MGGSPGLCLVCLCNSHSCGVLLRFLPVWVCVAVVSCGWVWVGRFGVWVLTLVSWAFTFGVGLV